MKRRLCSILLTCALISTLAPGAGAIGYGEEYAGYESTASQQYSDVPPEHWAYASIETCSQRSWFGGYPDGTFGPSKLIRRDEAAKVFAVALGLTLQDTPTISFTDTANSWAKAYIEATKYLFPNAANLQGTSSFRPDQTITREETIYALVVAWRYASKVNNADQSVLNMFSDAGSISAGVKPYVAVAINEGLVSGLPDGTIGAQKGLTRAEFATLLARALHHGYGPDSTDAPQIALSSYEDFTTAEQVTMTGKVSPMAAGTTLTCDGTMVKLAADGSFQVLLTLKEGTNTYMFVAENSYGVQSSQSVTLERGSENVTIRLLSTVPTETTEKSVRANGIIGNYTAECTFLLNNSMVQVDSEGLFEVVLDLKEGANTFKLVVMRKGEAVATQSIEITQLTTQGAGEWVETLPDGVTAAHYNIEQKSQIRIRTRQITSTTESNLPGWTLLQADGRWGDWSPWQNGAVSASDTRRIETQTVETAPGRTQYRYCAYSGKLNSAGAQRSGVTQPAGNWWRHFAESWMRSYTSEYRMVSTDWMDYPLTPVAGWSQTYDGTTARKYTYNGEVFYWEETQQLPPQTATQYRYQDYIGANVFEKWSDWSEWADGTASPDENTQVETRTMYRFTVK